MIYPSAKELINQFNLSAHPEGGYFSEIYTSSEELGLIDSDRQLAGSIYFLLNKDDISHFHQIDCEEIWYYHAGCGLKIYILNNGVLEIKRLGLNHNKDQSPMIVIPKGAIFAAENIYKNSFTFISCVTTPKFRYSGFRLVPYEEIAEYGIEKRLCSLDIKETIIDENKSVEPAKLTINFTWDGYAIWHEGHTMMQCYYKADIVLESNTAFQDDNKLSELLNNNPNINSLEKYLKKDLKGHLDYNFEEYCIEDEYYPPVAEDFELKNYLKDWCKEYGFEIISCTGRGYDDGYEPYDRYTARYRY